MKRVKLWWIALALLGVLTVWSVASAGRFLSSPAQTPDKADIIIALGGDTGGRVHMAQSLFAAGYAPHILLTGLEDGDAQTRPAYLNWRTAYLKAHGVPIDAILYDSQSSNSRLESINTLRLMKREGWRRALVVSDPPHLRRLAWTWGKSFNDSGCEFRLIAAPMPGWNAVWWWRHERSAQYVITEIVKLIYINLVY